MRIGLVGKRHAGKTTVANHLCSTHSYEQLNLADPLKTALVLTLNYFHKAVGLEANLTVKELEAQKEFYRVDLQRFGTEHGRFHDDRVWIKLFDGYLNEYSHDRIVTADVRFPNEAEELRNLGFTLIRVERDELARKQSIARQLILQHVQAYQYPLGLLEDLQERFDFFAAIQTELNNTLEHESEKYIDQIEVDGVVSGNTTVELIDNIEALVAFGVVK